MARRYDARTTIFSPDGRLYQVEYAMEAIGHAGAALGILATDGIILAAEKKQTSKLLEPSISSEKMYKIDDHIACAVAGITSDANILINRARLSAQQYLYTYQEPIPVEHLVQQLCDLKQGYTQYGGLRPFGVSFLYAGWDRTHGFQLYQSDPSGNYGGWKAYAIGANNRAAQSILKAEWTPTLNVHDALRLAVKILSKTMDSTSLSADKLDICWLTTPAVVGAATAAASAATAVDIAPTVATTTATGTSAATVATPVRKVVFGEVPRQELERILAEIQAQASKEEEEDTSSTMVHV